MASTTFWVVAVAARATRSVKAGVHKPASSPKRISKRKDRRLDTVQRLVQHPPQGDRSEQGGDLAIGRLGASAIPNSLETHLIGHVRPVVRLDVIERPFDDDPAQFPKPILQLGLELVAGLGVGSALRNRTMRRPISVITGTKRTVRGDKEVAKCVAERSAAHVAWSIGASFPVEEQSLVDPVTSQERRLVFQVDERTGLADSSQVSLENHRNSAKSAALARSHPADTPSAWAAVSGLVNPRISSDIACRTFLAATVERFWLSERLLRVDDAIHLASFSPAGGGKGVGVIIPNLLSYRGNCVVVDPKGENFRANSGPPP